MDSHSNNTKTRSTANLVARLGIIVLLAAALVASVDSVQADGLMFYAREDGEVRAFDIDDGSNEITIPNTAFFGDPPNPINGTRNIAYDPTTDLLWYSADDENVHSLAVGSMAAGPTISNIDGASAHGEIRTIAIDRSARRLYISNINGDVEVYMLALDQVTVPSRLYSIPLLAFGTGEANPGNRRRLAADAYSNLWFAAGDGTFKEFNPNQAYPHYTGREIPVSELEDPASPGQQRAIAATRWAPGEHYLHYATSVGTVATANLDTLTNAQVTFPANWFVSVGSPGELRSLSLDPTWIEPGSPPAMPTGVTASDGDYSNMVLVTWTVDPSFPSFWWVYRQTPGTGTWPTRFINWNNGFYEDTSAVPGVTYEYTVEACNIDGCSPYGIDTDTGYAGGLTPPSGLNASQGTFDDRVRVSWDAVPGAAGYLIGRVPQAGGLPTTAWVTGTTWDDTNALPEGSVWEYWAYACTDPSTCSASSGSVWGWIGTFIFVDGFETGDVTEWSDVQY